MKVTVGPNRHFGRWGWALLGAWIAVLVSAAPSPAQDNMFRYKNEAGRDVYTNHENLVPKGVEWEQMELPELIKLDLNKASHRELVAINDRIDREHFRMQNSSVCKEAVEKADMPLWRVVFEQHPHWLVIGAIMLLMLLANKAFNAMLPDGMWMRTIMFVAPLLILLGIMATVSLKSRQMIAQLKQDSALCQEDLGEGGDASSTKKKLGSLMQLQQTISAARDKQMAALRQIQRESR